MVADLTETVQSLRNVAARLRPPTLPQQGSPGADAPRGAVRGEVELQASWSAGKVVIWAGGAGHSAESHDEVSARLEAAGAAPVGWQAHPGVRLPGGSTADSHAIALADALGWLVSIGAGHRADEVGGSLRWLGRVAYEGVRLTASGSIVPTLRVRAGPRGPQVTAEVRWRPALVDTPTIAALAAAMPGPVAILGRENGRSTTIAVLTAVVEAIVAEGVERMELPAAPPSVISPRDVQDAVIAGMDGSPFQGPRRFIDDVAQALERWTRGVTSASRPKLIVQLDAPGEAGVWLVSILAATGTGPPVPIDGALRQERGGRTVTAEWERLGRAFPSIGSSTGSRRGQLALTQDQAWELMTTTGPTLAAIGFDVRVPIMSRRKATPMLRLVAESSDTVVGAHQLSNVSWSVLFDDVELTAADVARLATQARPLVRSRNGWVEVDRVDLEQAAAALAERVEDRQLTGAEILRHSLGLDGAGLRVDVRGHSWATEILARAGGGVDIAGHPAGGVHRRAAELPGRGPGVDRVPRARRPRWMPRPGHGPRQDPDGARAPRPGRGVRTGARDRSGGGRRQLGGRGGALRPRAARRHPPRHVAGDRGRAGGGDRCRRRPDHHVRHRGPRHRRPRRVRLGHLRARRSAGHQEPGERHGPAAAAHPVAHATRPHRHPDRERPR